MAVSFDYPPGGTPFGEDEKEGLIPPHIATQAQLNAWEQQNILGAERWAFARKRKNVLTIEFIRRLHKRMFGNTWKWAGTFRTTEKNIGIDPRHIAVELKKLCDDVTAQLQHQAYPLEELAARFHHRLTQIHPFPNGNGRHARLMTDLLLMANGTKPFTWGSADLIASGDARMRYIEALRAADRRDYGPLLAFVRSGEKA